MVRLSWFKKKIQKEKHFLNFKNMKLLLGEEAHFNA